MLAECNLDHPFFVKDKGNNIFLVDFFRLYIFYTPILYLFMGQNLHPYIY